MLRKSMLAFVAARVSNALVPPCSTALRRASTVVSSARSAEGAATTITDASLRELGLFCETPLLHSVPFSELFGAPVWLKMDALQARFSVSSWPCKLQGWRVVF